jgi:hypothetical protein
VVRTSHHPPRSTPDKEDIVKAEVAFAALLTAARLGHRTPIRLR